MTYLKVILTLLAIELALIALRPAAEPPIAYAQTDSASYHIEPGSTIIRDPDTGVQAQGRVVIDRRTGHVWGFPTSTNAPYPVVLSSKEPPVSKPIYLGRFDFSAMRTR